MNDIVKVCKKHGPLTLDKTVWKKRKPPAKCYLYCLFCNQNSRQREKEKGYWKKDQIKERKRIYFQKPEVKKRQRELQRKNAILYRSRKYGLTPNDYKKMFNSQNGRCAICKQKETRRHHISKEIRELSIDHNHSNGKVRQLLCSRCNMIIGNINESISLLQNMIDYLKKNG